MRFNLKSVKFTKCRESRFFICRYLLVAYLFNVKEATFRSNILFLEFICSVHYCRTAGSCDAIIISFPNTSDDWDTRLH